MNTNPIKETILYVDDEKQNLDSFRFVFRSDYNIIVEESPMHALDILKENKIPIVISDQRMPELTGLEFIKNAKELTKNTIFIILTAFADVDVIVQSMNDLKIYQYIQKPWNEKEFKIILNNALEAYKQRERNEQLMVELIEKNKQLEELNLKLKEQNTYLIQSLEDKPKTDKFITTNIQMKGILSNLAKIADSDAPVLIQGESGTGKELIAQAVHDLSYRKGNALIKVNCPALSESLIESELFGHEKGAFTGALKRKLGRFELAEGGTLFLDEIGDLPFHLQPKLLRAIQLNEFERVGGDKTIKTNVRIIAATNHNLLEAIKAKTFREDLYYRLNVFPINLPPLRERKDDVKLLIEFFINKYSKQYGKKTLKLSEVLIKNLTSYHWPGNIRELENLTERAVLLESNEIFNFDLTRESKESDPENSPELDSVLRSHIVGILKQTNWKIHGNDGAAKILGMKPTTLQSKIKKLAIKKYQYNDI